jgi:CubicO group peptidase (beta-lactamase class C family)
MRPEASIMSTMRMILLLTLASIVAAAQSKQAEVDKIFAAFNTHTPGCAVGVSKDGKVELTAGYGMADLERGVPITAATVFESGSVAKQFTAATLMLLEQQGKLSLDDKLGKYLTELQGAPASVTLRQVISHISGLREWRPIATFGGRPESDYVYSNRDLLEHASRQRALNFDPGSHYSYSNTGYNIATILVERALANSKTFQAFTHENIFAPLDMNDTRWRDNFRTIVPHRALAYTHSPATGLEQQTPIGNIIGAGGLLTTVRDLLKWNENFVHARVGGPAFVKAQQTPAVLTSGKSISYAAGLMVSTTDGLREVSHSGATGGYRTWLGRYPDIGVSVAVLCNSAQAVPTQLGRQTARLWTGATQITRNAAESTQPQSLAGLYRKVRDNTSGEIRWKDGKLLLGTSTELIPAAANQLRQVTPDGDIIYEKVEPAMPTPADLATLAGIYESSETVSKLTIAPATTPGQLTLRINNADPITLKPTYRDAFQSAEGTILFRRDAAGKVTELSVGDSRVWDLRFKKVK